MEPLQDKKGVDVYVGQRVADDLFGPCLMPPLKAAEHKGQVRGTTLAGRDEMPGMPRDTELLAHGRPR